METASAPRVVTANRLQDGLVVYLAADGGWSEWVERSRIATTEGEAEEALAAAKRAVEERQVVGPYLIDVTLDGGTVRPVRLREWIRSRGPTTHPEYGTQALRTGN